MKTNKKTATVDDFLPPWAKRKSTGRYMVEGTQLCTRDGRSIGNAVVVGVAGRTASVVTDFGNPAKLSRRELERLFHKPEYVMHKWAYSGGRAKRGAK